MQLQWAVCAELRRTPRGETAAERGDVGDTSPERGEVTVDRMDRYDVARSDRGVPLALPSCSHSMQVSATQQRLQPQKVGTGSVLAE